MDEEESGDTHFNIGVPFFRGKTKFPNLRRGVYSIPSYRSIRFGGAERRPRPGSAASLLGPPGPSSHRTRLISGLKQARSSTYNNVLVAIGLADNQSPPSGGHASKPRGTNEMKDES